MSRPRQNPPIVVDFDGVLFDAAAFAANLRDAVKPFGISTDRWNRAYAKRDENGVLRIVELADRLSAAAGVPAKRLLDAFAAETKDAQWFVHADVRPFLDRFRGRTKLYLLTFGDPGLQEEKLRESGIAPYFDGTYFIDRPKADDHSLPVTSVDRAIFINDDRREMLDVAQRYRWSYHLHINRTGHDPGHLPFPSYPDLRTAAEAIDSLLANQGAASRTSESA